MNIGPVHKKDVMKTSVMLERDNQYVIQEMYSTILNFNTYMYVHVHVYFVYMSLFLFDMW